MPSTHANRRESQELRAEGEDGFSGVRGGKRCDGDKRLFSFGLGLGLKLL